MRGSEEREIGGGWVGGGIEDGSLPLSDFTGSLRAMGNGRRGQDPLNI